MNKKLGGAAKLLLLLVFVALNASSLAAQSAWISGSASSVSYNATVSFTETVSAAQGDTLFNNYIWFRRPDGSTGLLMSTYTDYYFQNSRSASGGMALDQSGQWLFYAYGYTGDAPRTQQVIQSAPFAVNVAAPPVPPGAWISASVTSAAFGQTVTLTETVRAAEGDSLYNNYIWFQRPDGSTGIMMNTYIDYYYQYSRTASGTIELNQSGNWNFYAYGYTGDAPRSGQVIQSAPLTIVVGSPPAPSITSPLSVSYLQREPINYRITATASPTSFSAAGLPNGITINTATGELSGRSLGAGTFTSTISARNVTGTTSATLTWSIAPAVINSAATLSSGSIRQGDSVRIFREGSTNFTEGWTELKVFPPNGAAAIDLGDRPLHTFTDWSPTSGPGTYTFQYRVVDIYYNAPPVDQWLFLIVDPQVHTLPYSTAFEANEGYIMGNLYPQFGWLVQRGAADVVPGVGLSGAGVRIYGRSQIAEVKKFFSSAQSSVFLDIYAKPATGSTPQASSVIDFGSSKIGFTSTGGQGAVVAFNGDGNGSGVWQDTGVRFAISSSGQATGWQRLTVHHDYFAHRWHLIVNGTRAATNLRMLFDNVSSFTDLTLYGHATQDAYVDSLTASGTNPFSPSGPPGSLTFASITDTSATINWVAPSSVTPIASYDVQVNGASVGSVSGTSKVLAGLYPSTRYTVDVRANNVAGYSSNWASAAVITLADQTPPTVPTNLTVSALRHDSFILSWTASSDLIGVTGYEVKRDTTTLGSFAGLSITVSGLSQDSSYQMSVRARDAAGNWSAWTPALPVLTRLDPLGDKDNDGIKNAVEDALGTDPRSANATTPNSSAVQLNVHTPRQ